MLNKNIFSLGASKDAKRYLTFSKTPTKPIIITHIIITSGEWKKKIKIRGSRQRGPCFFCNAQVFKKKVTSLNIHLYGNITRCHRIKYDFYSILYGLKKSQGLVG
jgi:hypothetical protein